MLGIEIERWQNIYKDHHHQQPIVARVPAVKPESPSKPFSEVVRLYFKENTRADRTDSQIKSEFEKFLVILGGDRPVASITKADCRTYKEHILKDRSQTTDLVSLSPWAQDTRSFHASGERWVAELLMNRPTPLSRGLSSDGHGHGNGQTLGSQNNRQKPSQ